MTMMNIPEEIINYYANKRGDPEKNISDKERLEEARYNILKVLREDLVKKKMELANRERAEAVCWQLQGEL
jgi:hypothetical protein